MWFGRLSFWPASFFFKSSGVMLEAHWLRSPELGAGASGQGSGDQGISSDDGDARISVCWSSKVDPDVQAGAEEGSFCRCRVDCRLFCFLLFAFCFLASLASFVEQHAENPTCLHILCFFCSACIRGLVDLGVTQPSLLISLSS